MVVHTFNLSMWETEAGGSHEFQASQDYTLFCLKAGQGGSGREMAEYLLLLQRAWVPSPAPMCRLIIAYNSNSRKPVDLLSSVVTSHPCGMPGKHGYTIKINLKKKKKKKLTNFIKLGRSLICCVFKDDLEL